MEDLLRVGYQEQEACHALDFRSLCTFCSACMDVKFGLEILSRLNIPLKLKPTFITYAF